MLPVEVAFNICPHASTVIAVVVVVVAFFTSQNLLLLSGSPWLEWLITSRHKYRVSSVLSYLS